MKTERRHELQTNVLADWLGSQIERVRPYSRVVLGVVLAIAVAILLYGYTSVQTSRHSEERWMHYFSAIEAMQRGDVLPLTELADSPAANRTPMGYWAKLTMGDYSLNRGIDEMFNDRMSGRRTLESAVKYYAPVARQSNEPMLADRAKLGMARAYESLNELDQARKSYGDLIASNGPYSAEARQRLTDLEREPTKKFYDWFSAAKLPRPNIGGIGLPGDRPGFGSLPDEGSFVPPATDDERLFKLPGDSPKGSSGGEAATPAAGEQGGPTGEGAAAPATDKPATDTPAPAAGESAPAAEDKTPAANQPEAAGSPKTP